MCRRWGRHSECIQALPLRKRERRTRYQPKHMTDREFELRGPGAPVRFGISRFRLARTSPRVVWAIAVAILVGLVIHSWITDGYASDVLFVSGTVLTLGALLLLTS